jgi:hypothetical protein
LISADREDDGYRHDDNKKGGRTKHAWILRRHPRRVKEKATV